MIAAQNSPFTGKALSRPRLNGHLLSITSLTVTAFPSPLVRLPHAVSLSSLYTAVRRLTGLSSPSQLVAITAVH